MKRFWKRPEETAFHLRRLAERLGAEAAFSDVERLESEVRGLAAELEVGAGRIINPLRGALMGQGVSPGIFEVLEAMGRERALARIRAAAGFLDVRVATA